MRTRQWFWLILTLALALALTLVSAGGEGEAVTDGRYDASACDTRKNEDGSVSVLGMPGDPVPMTWGDFARRFPTATEYAGFEGLPDFAEPLYSNGQWVRVLMLDDLLLLRVCTDAPGDEGLLLSLEAVADAQNDTLSEYAKYFTFSLYSAASRSEGTFGETAILLLLIDPALDIRGYSLDDTYWYQNGFELYLGTQDDGYAVGRVLYTGEAARGAAMPPEGVMRPVSEAAFIARIEPLVNQLGRELTHRPDMAFGEYNTSTYFVGESTVLMLELLGQEGQEYIGQVYVTDISGYPTLVHFIGLSSLYALTDMSMEQLATLYYLNDANVTWNDLSALTPYVQWEGLVLQYSDVDDLPIAEIHGAQ